MKALPERFVLRQALHDIAQSFRVGPAQQSTAKRREADAEQQTQIHVSGVADNAFAQNQTRLDQHRQEEAVDDLVRRDLALTGAAFLEDRGESRIVNAA